MVYPGSTSKGSPVSGTDFSYAYDTMRRLNTMTNVTGRPAFEIPVLRPVYDAYLAKRRHTEDLLS